MLETPRILRYVAPRVSLGRGRDNATGAANQQERLNASPAGFVDEEGTFTFAARSGAEHHRGSRDTTLGFVVRRRRDRCDHVNLLRVEPLPSSMSRVAMHFGCVVGAS